MVHFIFILDYCGQRAHSGIFFDHGFCIVCLSCFCLFFFLVLLVANDLWLWPFLNIFVLFKISVDKKYKSTQQDPFFCWISLTD